MISGSLLLLAVIVGGANWAFRVLPILLHRSRSQPGGTMGRFLSATGPAAIGTLFVASVMPMVEVGPYMPLIFGLFAVGGVFAASRSVVLATLAGSAGYGLAVALGLG